MPVPMVIITCIVCGSSSFLIHKWGQVGLLSLQALSIATFEQITFLKFSLLQSIVLFMGPLIALFLTSGDVSSGFQKYC